MNISILQERAARYPLPVRELTGAMRRLASAKIKRGQAGFEAQYAIEMQNIASEEGHRKGMPPKLAETTERERMQHRRSIARGRGKKRTSQAHPLSDNAKVLIAAMEGGKVIETKDVQALIGDCKGIRKRAFANLKVNGYEYEARRDGHVWSYKMTKTPNVELSDNQARFVEFLGVRSRNTTELRAEFGTPGEITSIVQQLRRKGTAITVEPLAYQIHKQSQHIYTLGKEHALNQDRLLCMLLVQPVTTSQMRAVFGSRDIANAAMRSLRRLDYDITRRCLHVGEWEYTLIGEGKA